MPIPNSQDIVAIPYGEGVLLVGLGSAIPARLHRFALTSAPLAYSHLAAATADPGSKRRLREIAARVTTRHFTRDSDLLTFISQAAAAVNHQLMVVLLSPHQLILEQPEQVPKVIPGVGSLSLTDRFLEVIKRTPGHMPSELGQQLKAMLTTKALLTMAGTLALWAGAHALGGVPGLAIDALLVGVGIFFIGMGVFEVAKCIVDTITITLGAETEAELDQAASRLARAFVVAGITAIMALITKAQAKRVGQQYRQMQQARQAPKQAPQEQAPALPPGKDPGKIYSQTDAHPDVLYQKGELFRGDSRTPAQIKEAGGFKGYGDAPASVSDHLKVQRPPSQWVSTSKSEEVAKFYSIAPYKQGGKGLDFTTPEGYVYRINKPGGVDFGELGYKGLGNEEVAFSQPVKWSEVHSFAKYDARVGGPLEWVPNPDYTGAAVPGW